MDDCVPKAENLEAETESRSGELMALAEARRDKGGYGRRRGNHVRLHSDVILPALTRALCADLAHFEVVRFVGSLSANDI